MIGYAVPSYRVTRAPARVSFRARRIFHMATKLSDFFPAEDIVASRGSPDVPVTGLVMDSRRVVPGSLFFALPGLRADGALFIDEAVNRGAAAVVTSRLPPSTPARVTFLEVADPRAAMARAAQRYYRHPDRDLSVIGVTGTNGKTTITHLIKHFLEEKERAGLIGTVHYDLGTRSVPSFKTTPESIDIQSMLAQIRDAGCRHAVMEVSSHGIDQQRVSGMRFEVVVFTNLTRDHLDYHQNLEKYFEVKSRLFTGALGSAPGAAVINLDDPCGPRLVGAVAPGTRVIGYGESAQAMIRAEDVALGFKDTTFTLVWPGGRLPVRSPLIGRYNLSNLLAAVASVWSLGRDPAAFLRRLDTFPGVPGRMERIEEGQHFNVLVDYAHTDDALRNALGMLRAITPGRLLVVFGCGGNRDRAKRPLMVRAVQEAADFAFATADNPRSEPLAQIFSDMKTGVTNAQKIAWIEDRRRAISLALDVAQPGDCLLVAGKGHESYQEFADTVIPFDDRQVVRELIAIKALKH